MASPILVPGVLGVKEQFVSLPWGKNIRVSSPPELCRAVRVITETPQRFLQFGEAPQPGDFIALQGAATNAR